MTQEDLMTGNWAYHKNSKYPIKVGINDFKFSFDWAKPIELTEENIVELLGFEYNGDCYFKGIFDVFFNHKELYYKRFELPKIPKHVHKLQQLIKSLEE